MRWALWLIALFGVAVSAALGLSQQYGTVTLFVPPYRVDLSLNLVVIGLVLSFVLLYLAMRGIFSVVDLPAQARRWRAQQRERVAQTALLDALVLWMTGRYTRSRKAAMQALAQVDSLWSVAPPENLPSLGLMRNLLHLLAAESAHALRDHAAREQHFQQVLAHQDMGRVAQKLELRDAAYLNAVRWALYDRDNATAQHFLGMLPQGTARRTLALRLRLKVDRLGQNHLPALDTARMLAKHGAFSAAPALSLVRGLAMACLDDCHDSGQLQASWQLLLPQERQQVDVALHAAQRLLNLEGEPALALKWLMPVWQDLTRMPETGSALQRQRLVKVIARAMEAMPPDSEWLAKIEQARMANPRSMEWQYLSGMVCLRHGLWGKAQQMLEQVAPRITDQVLQRQAWRALAELAEQKGDSAQALACWKLSAKV